jgi:hypothetical protein
MFIATLWILQAVIMRRNIRPDIIRPHNKVDITHNRKLDITAFLVILRTYINQRL